LVEELSLTLQDFDINSHDATTIIHICTKRLQELRAQDHRSSDNLEQQKKLCLERATAVLAQQQRQQHQQQQVEVSRLLQHGLTNHVNAGGIFLKHSLANHASYSAFVALFAQGGFPEGASQLLHDMRRYEQTASLQAYTVTIGSYAREGRADSAFVVFEEMLNAKVVPSSRTLATLLNACRQQATSIGAECSQERREQQQKKEGGSSLCSKRSLGEEASLYDCAIASIRQMQASQQRGGSSYRGVRWNTQNRIYQAKIGYRGKRHYLGRFTNEVDAARAYDDAARRYQGSNARLNFPTKEEEAAQTKRAEAAAKGGAKGRQRRKPRKRVAWKMKRGQQKLPEEVRADLSKKVLRVIEVACAGNADGTQGLSLLNDQLAAAAVGVLAIELGDIKGALELHQKMLNESVGSLSGTCSTSLQGIHMGGHSSYDCSHARHLSSVSNLDGHDAFAVLMHACALAADIQTANHVLDAMRKSEHTNGKSVEVDTGSRLQQADESGDSMMLNESGDSMSGDSMMLNHYALSSFLIACSKAEARYRRRKQRKQNRRTRLEMQNQFKPPLEKQSQHQHQHQPRRYLELAERAFADWCMALECGTDAVDIGPSSAANGRGSTLAVCNSMMRMYVQMGMVRQAFELAAAMFVAPPTQDDWACERVDSTTLEILVKAMREHEAQVLSVCQQFCDRRKVSPDATSVSPDATSATVHSTNTSAADGAGSGWRQQAAQQHAVAAATHPTASAAVAAASASRSTGGTGATSASRGHDPRALLAALGDPTSADGSSDAPGLPSVAPSAIALVFDIIVLGCLEQGDAPRALAFYQEMSVQGLVLHSMAGAYLCKHEDRLREQKDRAMRRADMRDPEGSWECPSCANVNWPHRTSCNLCTIPRPSSTSCDTESYPETYDRSLTTAAVSADESDDEDEELRLHEAGKSPRGLLAKLLQQCNKQEELELVLGIFNGLEDMLQINGTSNEPNDFRLSGLSYHEQQRFHVESTCAALLEACERCGRVDWSATLLQQLSTLPRVEQQVVIHLDADSRSGADVDEDGPLAMLGDGKPPIQGDFGVEHAETLFLDWMCWRTEGGAVTPSPALPWRTQHDCSTPMR
jgi:pentatricopeptide repeat protein